MRSGWMHTNNGEDQEPFAPNTLATNVLMSEGGQTLLAALANYLLASAYTAADVLAKLLTVDGSGSGLDADKLQGKVPTDFVQAAAYTAADVLSKLLTVDGYACGLVAQDSRKHNGNDVVAVADGGTGATNKSDAKFNLGIQMGITSGISCAASSDTDFSVTFPNEFSSTARVVCVPVSNSTVHFLARPKTTSATGFVGTLYNPSGSAQTPTVAWIASQST